MRSLRYPFFLAGLLSQAPSEICDSAAREYFIAVSKNQAVKARIEKALEEADRSTASIGAFKKAFAPALQSVHIGEIPEKYMAPDAMDKLWEDVLADFYYKHMSEFIGKLK